MPWPDTRPTPTQAGLPHEQQSLAVLDFVHDGLLLLDAHGLITHVNASAMTWLHGLQADMPGRDFWDVVAPEVSDRHQSPTHKALNATGKHAFDFHHEFEGHWLRYSFQRHPAGCVVHVQDIATEKRLEHLLEGRERYNQLVFDANPNAMWLFDFGSLQILDANQAAIRFYGITRKQFLRLHMGALFPDGEGAVLLASLDARRSGHTGLPDALICKQRKADGTLVLVELACGHVSSRGHHAVLASIADVTERHLADRTLRRENSELEQKLADMSQDLANASRDMAAFTHALSNDLQAPLHVTNGFASMLAEKYAAVLDGPGLHYLRRIQASNRQLASLVDELRTLVQLPIVGRLERVDLAPICGAIVDDLLKREPARVLALEMPDSLMLWCDRNLLTTALRCLLGNAWKFTSRKTEGWIRVELQPGKGPDELVLRVSDNGAGFDGAYVDKLFTPFQRLHSSADFPGHGLGLAIVKRIAARHGGRVGAETVAQGGASFLMVFPQAGHTGVSGE